MKGVGVGTRMFARVASPATSPWQGRPGVRLSPTGCGRVSLGPPDEMIHARQLFTTVAMKPVKAGASEKPLGARVEGHRVFKDKSTITAVFEWGLH